MNIDFHKPAIMDDVLDIVTTPEEVKGASATLHQKVMRGGDVLVRRMCRVAFVSGGRARPIPKPLRVAMKADQEIGRRGVSPHASLADHDGTTASRSLRRPLAPAASSGRARGVAGVQLPQASAARRGARVQRRFPAAQETPPPAAIQSAIDGMIALLRGEPRDLTDIVIDNDGTPEFNARVYAIARQIPPGQTMTYGEIAQRFGDKLLARAVGQALGQNPCPIVMPCHRVLAAGGKSGGFSASGGVVTKLRRVDDRGAQPGATRRASARKCAAPPPQLEPLLLLLPRSPETY